MLTRGTKGRIIKKTGCFFLILLAVAAACFFFFSQSILSGAGRYLAPKGTGKAEAVILQGAEVIKEPAVRIGLEFLSSGRGSRLVVVYHKPEYGGIFGRPADYSSFLIRQLVNLGLKEEQIKVIAVSQEHPITLNEARLVLSHLAQDKIRNAILVSESFHTRRSYWVYKEVGAPLGIEIIPYPYFAGFQVDDWWQKAKGVREYLGESLKYLFYLVRGHIPLKSLLVTWGPGLKGGASPEGKSKDPC